MKKIPYSLGIKINTLIICFFLLISLNSCRQSTNNSIVITSDECYPPCWQNIVPGDTTKQEVILSLKTNPIVDINSIAVKGETWNSFSDVVFFKTQTNNISGEIDFINDRVAMINLFGDLQINFGEAIEKLGEPKYILNIPTFDGLPGLPETNYEIIALIPNKGIEYAYNTHDNGIKSKSELIAENKITDIGYFNPDTYNKLLEAGMFSEGFLNGEETLKFMLQWNGYGELGQKYPSATIEFK